jgi:hypothetical protein
VKVGSKKLEVGSIKDELISKKAEIKQEGRNKVRRQK